MELELAIVESCGEDGCAVRCRGREVTVQVDYAAVVRDRIRIRRGDLVAVNHTPAAPEIVWRWWKGEVLEPLATPPAPGHVFVGERGVVAEARLSRPDQVLSPGDRVWLAKSDRGVEVVDRAVAGEPERPEWIRRRWFLLVEEAYAALGSSE